jgi:RNA polymerase sigma factor for flagellar operon FliA
VYGHAQTSERRVRGAQAAFPDKTNPNRPTPAASEPQRELRGEARPFPERCHPDRSRAALTDEQRDLATRYMPIARMLARQAARKSGGFDDLEAEAYAALVEAARSFDPDRGVNFAVFARPRILGALRDYRRFLFHAGRTGDPQESPVFQRLSTTEVFKGRVLGREPDAPPGEGLDSLAVVESILRLLPRSEATACRLLYVDGMSYAETAESLGCSKGHLSRLHTEAMARLRRDYREALAG